MWISGAVVVVTFEPAADVTLAAVWDGGPWCYVHTLEDGKYGPRLEAWDMHDPWTDAPAIECTPAALQQLVEYRMADTLVAGELVTWARSYSGWQNAPVPPNDGAPMFSRN
jgi:hypothetical protein